MTVPNDAESNPASNPVSTGDRSFAAAIPADDPTIPPATPTDMKNAIFCDFVSIPVISASPSRLIHLEQRDKCRFQHLWDNQVRQPTALSF
jgi:hypothetical protein